MQESHKVEKKKKIQIRLKPKPLSHNLNFLFLFHCIYYSINNFLNSPLNWNILL